MGRLVWSIALAWLTMAANTVQGQEEKLVAGRVRTKGPVVMRAAPRNGADRVSRIAGGTELQWIAGPAKRGFLRVIGPTGPLGWVRTKDLDTLETPPPATIGLTASQPPCVSDLADCTEDGCGQAGSTQALVNEVKRRVGATGPATVLTFSDFGSIQDQADNLVGEGHELTDQDRGKLQGLTVSAGTVGEGSLVRTAAFIALGPSPHANTGESVNCRLKGARNNDFHINIAENISEDGFDGLVVEMIPQDRPESWTLTALKKFQTNRRRILVEGNLFYDNKHVVNADRANPISGQPARFALWEIHRITRFWTCPKADHSCDPEEDSQWTEVK